MLDQKLGDWISFQVVIMSTNKWGQIRSSLVKIRQVVDKLQVTLDAMATTMHNDMLDKNATKEAWAWIRADVDFEVHKENHECVPLPPITKLQGCHRNWRTTLHLRGKIILQINCQWKSNMKPLR